MRKVLAMVMALIFGLSVAACGVSEEAASVVESEETAL